MKVIYTGFSYHGKLISGEMYEGYTNYHGDLIKGEIYEGY
jgi:hypothetical protein